MKKRDYEGPILEIDSLSISFFTRLREIPAVMDFSCTVQPGEAMGLVGESGCGKSTVALGVMQDLGVNGRIVGGTINHVGPSWAPNVANVGLRIPGWEGELVLETDCNPDFEPPTGGPPLPDSGLTPVDVYTE